MAISMIRKVLRHNNVLYFSFLNWPRFQKIQINVHDIHNDVQANLHNYIVRTEIVDR